MDQEKSETLTSVEKHALQRALNWTTQIRDKNIKSVITQSDPKSIKLVKTKIYETN